MNTILPTHVLVAAVVVTLAACLSACSVIPGEDAADGAAEGVADVNSPDNTVQPFPVEAVVVSPRTLTRSIVASGRLMAIRRSKLSAGVSGKASEVLVREGDRVTAGDLLLRLDEAPFKLGV